MIKKTQFHLTDRFFLFLGFSQLLGISALVFPPLGFVYLLGSGLLFILALIDYGSIFRLLGLKGSVIVPKSPEIGQCLSLFVQVLLRGGKWVSSISAVAPPLKTLKFDHFLTDLPSVVREGQVWFEAQVSATAWALGYEKIEQMEFHVYSRFGFMFRRVTTEVTPTEFRVLPTRRKISESAFEQMTRDQRLLTQGSRQRLRGAEADQFYSIREYQYPDSIRHIDPKKSAKYMRPMTRVYDSLRQHHLILALDVGRSMVGKLGNSQKLDYYLSACLALAQGAAQARDRVSFFAFSQKVHYSVRASRHLESFRPLFTGHPQLRAREEESDFSLIYPSVTQMSGQRSLVVILADVTRPSVQEELLKFLIPVARKHLTVIVSLIDEDYALEKQLQLSEQTGWGIQDYNRLLYSYWLDENARLFRSKMAALGGAVAIISEKDWLSTVEKVYFLLRESMRI